MAVLLDYFIILLYYLAVLVLLVVFTVYIYFKYTFQYWKKRGVEYLEPTLLFGNIAKCFDGSTHVNDVFREIHEQIKGPFAGVYFLHKPALFIKDPQLLRHILVKDFNSFIDRGVHSDGESDPLSLHLFRLSGGKWKNLRNKLSPVFTSGKLKMMYPTIIKTAEQLQNALEMAAETGETINTRDVCARYNVDIISTTAFGIETNSFSDPMNKMCTFIQNFTRSNGAYTNIVKTNLSVIVPEVLLMLKQSSHSQSSIDFISNMVRNVTDYRFTKKVFRNDFLQLLIQLRSTGNVSEDDFGHDVNIYEKKDNDQCLSFNELVAQAYIFIMAGYETSSVTMGNCLFELARNPKIQRRVQKNIDDIVAKHNGQFTYESVFEMDYLVAAVSETMRKYPPLGFLNRIAADEYTIPNSNIVIEKGTKILISVDGIQNDPENFPSPKQFDPDRFTAENKDNIKPFTYLPFGDGPRHCIGTRLGKLQTMIGLAMILNKYNFEVCPETPLELTLLGGTLISVPKETIKLAITKRT